MAVSSKSLREYARMVQAHMAEKNPVGQDETDDGQIKALIRTSVDEVTRYDEEIDEEARREIAERVANESLGYGALQPLLDDEDITEIMVNGYKSVFVEVDGFIEAVDEELFESNDDVKRLIDKIASEVNKHCDIQTPDMDARLADGSRVNAIIPPISMVGPCLTIRKFPKHRLDAVDLIEKGSVSLDAMNFLACAVRARCNILVSGGTGSGKTTLLNILSSFIPEDERVITVEDTAELKLSVENWIPLEARSENADGTGAVTIHRLVVDSLRMRPDRIIVGECRSDETIEMLQAMNTGHDGSLTTIHANDPRAAFIRIEEMVQAVRNLNEHTIDKQIATAIQIVVQTRRYRDGTRKISEIVALTGNVEGSNIQIAPLYSFVQQGNDENGRVIGSLVPTGNMLPEQIVERIDISGAFFDPEWLRPERDELEWQ